MISDKIASLKRAADKALDLLASRPGDVEMRGHGHVDRADALVEAQTIRVIAAGLLAAAEVAVDTLKPPPPPENHHHVHHHPRPLPPSLSDMPALVR